MESIPESEKAKEVVNLETERLPTKSALGLKWNINDDKLVRVRSEEVSEFGA